MDIIKKIKSFEDACSVLKREASVPDFSMIAEKDRKALTAHYKLIVICEALNEVWTPDWTNNEWKYYPWFYMDDEGSSGRFSFLGSVSQRSYSLVGSRLCFKSRRLAKYAAEQFLDLYRDYFLL